MTNAWIISDMHIDAFEYFEKRPYSLDVHPECDLILMAGDLADGDWPGKAAWLKAEFSDDERSRLVYVPGNHDAYGIGLAGVPELMRRLVGETGIIALDNDVAEVAGHRIVGTALWSPFGEYLDEAFGHRGDFKVVPGLTPDAWRAEHQRNLRWLAETLEPGDILMTHHAVGERGLHAEMRRNTDLMLVDSGYYAPLDDFIAERQPQLVVHGHTHVHQTYLVEGVPVVSNARGRSFDRHFRPDFTIGIDGYVPKPLGL
jgi:predicted phosphodiesterase